MTVVGLAIEFERRRGGAPDAQAVHAQSSAPLEARAISALSLAWGGSARADFDANRLNGDRKLSLRFMAAYEAAFRGILLADESGSYRVGLAPYASLGAAAIEVRVGGAIVTYPLPASTLTDNDFRDGVPRRRARNGGISPSTDKVIESPSASMARRLASSWQVQCEPMARFDWDAWHI